MDDTTPASMATPPPPPPPGPPPPPLISSTPPPRRRGRGWMVVTIILFLLLCLSLLGNLTSITSSFFRARPVYTTHSAGPRFEEVIREDNASRNKIAIVEVDGIITSQGDGAGYSLVDLIKAELKRAGEDSRVRAVILKVDSPGGEVLASDEIYRSINDFQNDFNKPVVASMGNLAASGGYYISAPCRWIVANEMTLTGSIGVILHSYNYRQLMDKVGLLPQTFKSGKHKDMLSGDRPPGEIPPEEKEMIQALVDETFGRFKSIVEEGRTGSFEKNREGKYKSRALSSDWEEYADGRVLSGTEAFKLGFVDELGNFEDAVKRAQKLAGISEANLIQYQQRIDFADIFRLFGSTESRSVKVDLGLETPKLQAGRLYFLSPTFIR